MCGKLSEDKEIAVIINKENYECVAIVIEVLDALYVSILLKKSKRICLRDRILQHLEILRQERKEKGEGKEGKDENNKKIKVWRGGKNETRKIKKR